MMYTQDYDEKLVSSWDAYPNQFGGASYWMGMILPYTKNTGIYRCPSFSGPAETLPQNPQMSSYGHSHNFLGWGLAGTPGMADVQSPADTIYFAERARRSWAQFIANPDDENVAKTNDNDCTACVRAYTQCAGCPAGGPYGMGACCSAVTVGAIHSGMANIGFVDGHVKAMRASQAAAPYLNPALRGGPTDLWDRL
jgi:prepilin-type processing-associated H-X9-DG protein